MLKILRKILHLNDDDVLEVEEFEQNVDTETIKKILASQNDDNVEIEESENFLNQVQTIYKGLGYKIIESTDTSIISFIAKKSNQIDFVKCKSSRNPLKNQISFKDIHTFVSSSMLFINDGEYYSEDKQLRIIVNNLKLISDDGLEAVEKKQKKWEKKKYSIFCESLSDFSKKLNWVAEKNKTEIKK